MLGVELTQDPPFTKKAQSGAPRRKKQRVPRVARDDNFCFGVFDCAFCFDWKTLEHSHE